MQLSHPVDKLSVVVVVDSLPFKAFRFPGLELREDIDCVNVATFDIN